MLIQALSAKLLGVALAGVIAVPVAATIAGGGEEIAEGAAAAADVDPTSLRGRAARHDLRIGTAVSDDALLLEPDYQSTLINQFNTVTSENSMKWDHLRPDADTFDFEASDRLVNFAEENGMSVRGHTLVWHDQNPEWLVDAATDRDTAIELLREHITTVVGRYAGRVDQWDVVNEPLAVETNGDLHDSIWLDMIGPEYIDLAFGFARAADPTAELFINEFDGVSPGPKTDRLITLAAELQARGVEIDGVGFEFHVLGSFDIEAVEAKLHTVADLGLRVALTEVDAGIRLPVTAEKVQAQAEIFAGLLQACLNVSTCDTYVMWGFTDRHSWIPSVFAGYADATIYDADIEPKPAYWALQDVLAS